MKWVCIFKHDWLAWSKDPRFRLCRRCGQWQHLWFYSNHTQAWLDCEKPTPKCEDCDYSQPTADGISSVLLCNMCQGIGYRSEVCELPPKGWHCTRKKYHEGPCAAVPDSPPLPTVPKEKETG